MCLFKAIMFLERGSSLNLLQPFIFGCSLHICSERRHCTKMIAAFGKMLSTWFGHQSHAILPKRSKSTNLNSFFQMMVMTLVRLQQTRISQMPSRMVRGVPMLPSLALPSSLSILLPRTHYIYSGDRVVCVSLCGVQILYIRLQTFLKFLKLDLHVSHLLVNCIYLLVACRILPSLTCQMRRPRRFPQQQRINLHFATMCNNFWTKLRS